MTVSRMADLTPVGEPMGPKELHSSHQSAGAQVREVEMATSDLPIQSSTAPVFGRSLSVGGAWKMSLGDYKKRKDEFAFKANDSQHLSRKTRSYYKRQLALIEAYEELERLQYQQPGFHDTSDIENKTALRLSQISFAANFCLMVIKIIASVQSDSLSVISSLVDSFVDLLSGTIIWYTSHAVRKTDYHLYPSGRKRLEPLAIFLLSVLMSVASLLLIVQSAERVVQFTMGTGKVSKFDMATVTITASVVAIKLSLFLACYVAVINPATSSASLRALTQDHRNDTLSNAGALLCGYLGSQQFAKIAGERNVIYIDPIGAAVIGLYILVGWWRTGAEQISYLTGMTADGELLSKLTWLCLNHSPLILRLDKLKAYHCGTRLLVEVAVVLPRDIPLQHTHDVADSLQHELEKLDEVERAIVHVCAHQHETARDGDTACDGVYVS